MATGTSPTHASCANVFQDILSHVRAYQSTEDIQTYYAPQQAWFVLYFQQIGLQVARQELSQFLQSKSITPLERISIEAVYTFLTTCPSVEDLAQRVNSVVTVRSPSNAFHIPVGGGHLRPPAPIHTQTLVIVPSQLPVPRPPPSIRVGGGHLFGPRRPPHPHGQGPWHN